jgi:hypothetical protein
MMSFRVGDAVVYCKTKVSKKPGPRAADVHPCEHGDDYRYIVDKYWRVAALGADGSLEVVTRTGKRRTLRADDMMLRKASLVDRLLRASRFPSLPDGGVKRE